MKEEKFSSFNPINETCNYCQQDYTRDSYMYPFPGLPFGFENMWDEDEWQNEDLEHNSAHERKDSDQLDRDEEPQSENLQEGRDTEDINRAPNKVDEILYRIERNNPMLLRSLTMSGIPYRAARNIVRQIIYLTLSYSKKTPR